MLKKHRQYLNFFTSLITVVYLVFGFNAPIVFADSLEIVSSMRILPVVTEEEAPTSIPGGAPPGLVVPPYREEDIFVAGEEGYHPYVRVMMVAGEPVIDGVTLQTQSREPEILGKTNLRNSILFLEFDRFPGRVYTTFANLQGAWRLISPVYLEVGVHTLYITAMSSMNPYFKATQIFQFEVIPIPLPGEVAVPVKILPAEELKPIPLPSPAAPVLKLTPEEKKIIPSLPPEAPRLFPKPTQTPTPPKMPADGQLQPSPIIATPPEKLQDGYGLKVEILPEAKVITGSGEVNIKLKIARPAFGEPEAVLVRFIVRNQDNEIVYEKIEKYIIEKEIELDKKIMVSPASEGGKYTVTFEIMRDGVTYLGSDSFEVIKKEGPLEAPLSLFLKMAGNKDVLFPLITIFVILFAFIILCLCEYRQSKRCVPLAEDDFKDDGYI